MTVEEAYRQALNDYQSEDRLIEGKKQWLEGQLDVIEAKVRQVNLNYAEVLQQIEEAAATAKEELERLTYEKLEALLSAEIEIRREKEHLAWMDSVLQKTAHVCSAKIEKALASRASEGETSGESKAMGSSTTSAVANSRAVNASQLSFLESWKYATQLRNNSVRVKPTEHIDAIREVTPNIRIKTNFELYHSSGQGDKGKDVKGRNGKMDGKHSTGAPRGPLADTLDHVEGNSYYTETVQAAQGESVHPLLASVLDMETDKIQSVLLNMVNNPDAQPLPRVVYNRPPMTRDTREEYSIPLSWTYWDPRGMLSQDGY